MNWENYECDGQMTIDEYLGVNKTDPAAKKQSKSKPLKYHMSLTAYYTKCPYCGAENSEKQISDDMYECKNCHSQMIGVTEIKSKDYKEVERLGLKGLIGKDDKGRWAEVHYDAKGNRYLTYGGGNDAQK